VADYLSVVDQVLVMSVHPGFGGQAFIPEALEKVRWVRERAPALDVEIDGGISPETAPRAAAAGANVLAAPRAAAAGANVLVAGTAIFGAADRRAAIQALRQACAAVSGEGGGLPGGHCECQDGSEEAGRQGEGLDGHAPQPGAAP